MPSRTSLSGAENEEIQRYLASLPEDEVRSHILVPLLLAMGYSGVTLRHGGTPEKGKDIVCYYNDPTGERRYISVVVKRGDIHGAVGQHGNAAEALTQIEQSFDEPYMDAYELKDAIVSECWVVTTGLVKPSAIESVRGHLHKTNLDRLVRFCDGPRLAILMQKHMPDFWPWRRYLLDLAHNIRGPLSSIMVQAANIRDGVYDAPRARKAAQRVYAEASDCIMHVRTLSLNDLLTSREAGLSRPSEEPLDLAIELESVAQILQPIAEPRNIRLNVDSTTLRRLPSIPFDKELFSVAIWHIVDNAVRYSFESTTVTIHGAVDMENVHLFFENYGLELRRSDTYRLGTRGFRSTEAQVFNPSGAGIGLWLAGRIMRLHGGKVIPHATDDEGRTVIEVSIPVAPRRRSGRKARVLS